MKIELKKVQFFARMSEETNAFVANIYIDGKLAGDAKNEGMGGNTHVRINPEMRVAFEAYIKTLPDKVYPAHPEMGIKESFSVKMSDEGLIDGLFDEWLKQDDERKQKASIARYAKKAAERGFPFTVIFKKNGKASSYQAFRLKDDASFNAAKVKNGADTWEVTYNPKTNEATSVCGLCDATITVTGAETVFNTCAGCRSQLTGRF